MRLDALEVGEIESRISVEIALEEQGKSLREYRFHLNAKRRELVRERLLKLIDDIDVLIKMLVSLTDGMPINGELKSTERLHLKEAVHAPQLGG